jgi:hypothetical protein
MGMAWALLYVKVWAASGYHYRNINWGGHQPTVENLSAFAVAGGRMFLYLLTPSMPLLANPAAKVFAGAAVLASFLFVAALVLSAVPVGFKQRRHAGLFAAVAASIVLRSAFSFWWMPENSEQLITPWFLSVYVSALILLQSPGPLPRFLPALGAAAAALAAAGNLHFVSAPAARIQPPYLDVVREAARMGSQAGLDVSFLMTDDPNVSHFHLARKWLLSAAELADHPKTRLVYLNWGGGKVPDREDIDKMEKQVTETAGQLIARQGRALWLTSSRGPAYGFDDTPNRNSRSPSSQDVPSVTDILLEHFRLHPGPRVGDYRLWIVGPKEHSGQEGAKSPP